jgi:ABC-type transporter Mla MlaB component
MGRSRIEHSVSDLTMYQHDAASLFRFVLMGRLAGRDVEDMEHAWITARSVMDGKELVVDLSAVTEIDGAGMHLLARVEACGARVIYPAQPARTERVAAPVSGWRRWFRLRGRDAVASVTS